MARPLDKSAAMRIFSGVPHLRHGRMNRWQGIEAFPVANMENDDMAETFELTDHEAIRDWAACLS
ncbi:MAG: hypothetical protein R3E51_16125 [Rhizobiaceae bacterium]